MTVDFTFNLLFAIAAIGGVLAFIDGIRRTGRRSRILGVIEIIASALFVLSLFFGGVPFGSLVLAIVTVVVLVIGLVLRGRGSTALSIIALILLVVWIVLAQHWLMIPGLNA